MANHHCFEIMKKTGGSRANIPELRNHFQS
jgi:hypothetical protein